MKTTENLIHIGGSDGRNSNQDQLKTKQEQHDIRGEDFVLWIEGSGRELFQISQHSSGRTEENHETFRIQVWYH